MNSAASPDDEELILATIPSDNTIEKREYDFYIKTLGSYHVRFSAKKLLVAKTTKLSTKSETIYRSPTQVKNSKLLASKADDYDAMDYLKHPSHEYLDIFMSTTGKNLVIFTGTPHAQKDSQSLFSHITAAHFNVNSLVKDAPIGSKEFQLENVLCVYACVRKISHLALLHLSDGKLTLTLADLEQTPVKTQALPVDVEFELRGLLISTVFFGRNVVFLVFFYNEHILIHHCSLKAQNTTGEAQFACYKKCAHNLSNIIRRDPGPVKKVRGEYLFEACVVCVKSEGNHVDRYEGDFTMPPPNHVRTLRKHEDPENMTLLLKTQPTSLKNLKSQPEWMEESVLNAQLKRFEKAYTADGRLTAELGDLEHVILTEPGGTTLISYLDELSWHSFAQYSTESWFQLLLVDRTKTVLRRVRLYEFGSAYWEDESSPDMLPVRNLDLMKFNIPAQCYACRGSHDLKSFVAVFQSESHPQGLVYLFDMVTGEYQTRSLELHRHLGVAKFVDILFVDRKELVIYVIGNNALEVSVWSIGNDNSKEKIKFWRYPLEDSCVESEKLLAHKNFFSFEIKEIEFIETLRVSLASKTSLAVAYRYEESADIQLLLVHFSGLEQGSETRSFCSGDRSGIRGEFFLLRDRLITSPSKYIPTGCCSVAATNSSEVGNRLDIRELAGGKLSHEIDMTDWSTPEHISMGYDNPEKMILWYENGSSNEVDPYPNFPITRKALLWFSLFMFYIDIITDVGVIYSYWVDPALRTYFYVGAISLLGQVVIGVGTEVSTMFRKARCVGNYEQRSFSVSEHLLNIVLICLYLHQFKEFYAAIRRKFSNGKSYGRSIAFSNYALIEVLTESSIQIILQISLALRQESISNYRLFSLAVSLFSITFTVSTHELMVGPNVGVLTRISIFLYRGVEIGIRFYLLSYVLTSVNGDRFVWAFGVFFFFFEMLVDIFGRLCCNASFTNKSSEKVSGCLRSIFSFHYIETVLINTVIIVKNPIGTPPVVNDRLIGEMTTNVAIGRMFFRWMFNMIISIIVKNRGGLNWVFWTCVTMFMVFYVVGFVKIARVVLRVNAEKRRRDMLKNQLRFEGSHELLYEEDEESA